MMRRNFLRMVLSLCFFSLSISTIFAENPGQYASSGNESSPLGVLFGLFFTFLMMCCFALPVIAYFGVKIYLTVDALQRDYGEDENMLLIGLVIIWLADPLPLAGALIYYFIVMQKYPKKS